MTYISIKEYAARVGLSEAFIRSLVASEQLPSLLIGTRKRKINVEEADEALKAIKMPVKEPKPKLSFKEQLRQLRMGCA